MSPSEKLQRTLEWSDIIRKFAEAGMRQRCPNADERAIFLRMARQNLGPELFRKVYGGGWHDPATPGHLLRRTVTRHPLLKLIALGRGRLAGGGHTSA
jgi:hypothetical protein